MFIPDPDFLSIPDPTTAPKEEGKNFFGLHRHCRHSRPPPAYAVGEEFFLIISHPVFFVVETGVPDPDPFVRGTGTDPDPSIIKQK